MEFKEQTGLRILYHANAPWAHTGYGVQSNSLLPRLAKMPEIEEIALFAYYGIHGGVSDLWIGEEMPVDKVKLKCYPPRLDAWGNDVIHDHIDSFNADLAITLFDLWPLSEDFGWRGARHLPWFPVDHEPIPMQVLNRTRWSYENLVYSRSAAEELKKNGVHHTYIPHGVETTIYKPKGEDERREAKRALGFDPDCFLIGTVGANKGYPPRKGWNEMLTAIRAFKDNAPNSEKINFYWHSLFTGEQAGPDLIQMAQDFGLGDCTRFPNAYRVACAGVPFQEMVDIYNAMDVFILLSRGEGFGLPILEAQACGTPVIVTDFTACRELGVAGYRVPVMYHEWTPQRSFWGQADPNIAADMLMDVYTRWLSQRVHGSTPYQEMRERAREFSLPYDWDKLVEENWKPLIQWLWAEVRPRFWGPAPLDCFALPSTDISTAVQTPQEPPVPPVAKRSRNGAAKLEVVNAVRT